MGYVVGHRDATGVVRLEDVESLDQAIALVERLRNEDGTSDVRVFREVPFEVRTYYKVVVTEDEDARTPAPVEVAVAASAPPAAPAASEPAAEVGAGTETSTGATADPLAPLLAPPVDPPRPVAVPSAASQPPPGAMPMTPLAPVSAAPPADPEDDVDDDADRHGPGRRTSRFGRGG